MNATATKTAPLPPKKDIQRELERVGGETPKPRWIDGKYRRPIVISAAALLILFLFRSFLALTNGGFFEHYRPFLGALVSAAILCVFVFVAALIVQMSVIDRNTDAVSRYNLNRVLRLVTGLILTFIILSLLFAHWYAAAVSLGLVSLILGLALQSPLSSFFAWIYILVRQPYRVGDRIKIGNSTGDVIEVGYLDTILWEFGGDFLSTDHPSGRIIKFPNSTVFNTAVYNYSWPLFPYVWNEIKFQIAYDSDLDFVAEAMKRIVEEELGSEMIKHVKTFRKLLARTPVNELEVREQPSVSFRPSENTWIEAMVRYLVHPKQSGRVKNVLIKKLLTELNSQPDKVLFPKSNAR